jgi:hypothetical protein
MINPSDNHDKVMAYGLAYLLNHAAALANGMEQNLPVSDVMKPQEILDVLGDLIEMNKDNIERWGLGHLLPD